MRLGLRRGSGEVACADTAFYVDHVLRRVREGGRGVMGEVGEGGGNLWFWLRGGTGTLRGEE